MHKEQDLREAVVLIPYRCVINQQVIPKTPRMRRTTMPVSMHPDIRKTRPSHRIPIVHKVRVERRRSALPPPPILPQQLRMHCRRAARLAEAEQQYVRAVRDRLVRPRAIIGVFAQQVDDV